MIRPVSKCIIQRTEFKLEYVTTEALKYSLVFISFTPLFPIFALAHIFGRFLLQFQFPLGNTSSVTFHLLNICLEEKKKVEMRKKRVQKRMTGLSLLNRL